MVVLRSGKIIGSDLDDKENSKQESDSSLQSSKIIHPQLCIPIPKSKKKSCKKVKVIKKDKQNLSINDQVKYIKEKVDEAFHILTNKGYFCARNFTCCNTCAWAEVPSKFGNKAIFWHEQNEENLNKEGNCFIGWGDTYLDGVYIKKIFEKVGLTIKWDYSPYSKMQISY